MITLPNNRLIDSPVFTVYYRDEGIRQWIKIETMGDAAGGYPFTNIQKPQIGIYVAEVSQVALPNFGTASLEMMIGNVNTVNYNFDDTGVTALDLKNKEIYISTGGRVVFWGVVDYQKDVLTPSATPYIIGKRIYRASDLLFYTCNKAQMNKHGYATESYIINRAQGMPAYNGREGRDGLIQGNKGTSSFITPQDRTEPMGTRSGDTVQVQRFTFDGTGNTWTDGEVVLHAIHNGQERGQLIEFTVDDPANLLNRQVNKWPVRENERVWNFIRKILRFQRGAGVSVFTYDTASNGAPENPRILVNPLHDEDITITLPEDGSQEVVDGSQTVANATVDVDLIGDHRQVDSFFSLGGVEDFRYDRIEILGEKIQVMCSLETAPESLAKLWSDQERTNFDNLSADDTDQNTYDHVLRLFGLPRDWDGVTYNGNGGTGEPSNVFFFCDDAGELRHAGQGIDAFSNCNPSMIRILPDIPLHDGIDPETGGRLDAGDAVGTNARQRILAHEVISSDIFSPLSITPRIRSDGIWIGARDPADFKSRSVGSSDMADIEDEILLTLAIELPHRVYVARGEKVEAAANTKRVILSGAHLWIGAKNSIYSISQDNTVKRFSDTTLLRDDRNRIAYIAGLVEHWYLNDHRTAKWAIRDFGIGGSFEALVRDSNATTAKMHNDSGRSIPITSSDGLQDIEYPKIGQIVNDLKAFSATNKINAPLTSVRYDNKSGTTFYICDWGELEL